VKVFLSEEVKSQLQGCDAYAEMEGKLSDAFARWDRLSQAQFLEVASLLQGYLLSSQGDRMAMAHSVEGRYPFLDYRLVEFSTKMPAHLKMKVLNEKYILKRAAGHLVPSSVRARSKQPYRAPDASSFFDPSSGTGRSEYVEELLCGKNLRRDDLFNASAVAKLVDKARRGKLIGAKDNMALVGIISTQLLVEQFMNKRGVQSNVLS
jgi:asparagine synthase (glutamine-hydrolysing)